MPFCDKKIMGYFKGPFPSAASQFNFLKVLKVEVYYLYLTNDLISMSSLVQNLDKKKNLLI